MDLRVLTLALGTDLAQCRLVGRGLGNRQAGVPRSFALCLLHEHGQHQRHQQTAEECLVLRADPALLAEIVEPLPEDVKLLAQRDPVHRRHHSASTASTRPVAPRPVHRFALDPLPVSEVPPRTDVPVRPTRREVEPQFLGDNAGLVVDLDLGRVPVGQVRIVERRGIAGDHHFARQQLQEAEEHDMVIVRVVKTVATLRQPARRLHVD